MNLYVELNALITDKTLLNQAEYDQLVQKCRLAASNNQTELRVPELISQPVQEKLRSEGLTVTYNPGRRGFDPYEEFNRISWKKHTTKLEI